MTTRTIVWIVAAVAAVPLIAGLVWLARSKRYQHRHMEAGKVREAAKGETLHVRQQEAVADGTCRRGLLRPDRSRRLGGPGVRSTTASRRPTRRGSHLA